jgi:hypothetical protein
LDIFREKPHGYRERVAVLKNNKLKENLVIEYEYDTRTLSTSATRDVIKGTDSIYGFSARDVIYEKDDNSWKRKFQQLLQEGLE